MYAVIVSAAVHMGGPEINHAFTLRVQRGAGSQHQAHSQHPCFLQMTKRAPFSGGIILLETTFHSSSNLVSVPVIALKNGLPDRTLKRDDFQVFDNGHPVSIKTFDSGAQFSTSPLAVWFVVQCSMQDYEAQGSGFFRERISLFKPALKYLDKQDTVAVAHWCDNGDSQLDLLPTSNVEEAASSLD
jgi:hypothetical protein